jgi:Thymidylate synthase
MAAVAEETIGAAWEAVVAIVGNGSARRLATRFGVTFDLPGLTIEVANPADLTLPDGFRHPSLVAEYISRLSGDDRAVSLLHKRLTQWPSATGTVDQLAAAEQAIRDDGTTRSAVYGLWDGGLDVGAPNPVSPVAGGFRMIEGALHQFLAARSVDVLVGLVPELIAFARLQQDLASRLSLEVGPLHYVAWSAHVYEVDYVAYIWRK